MFSYQDIKHKHGTRVYQTIDMPIMVFDYFEISDVFIALGVVLVFGVVLYSWWLMFFVLLFVLGAMPAIKRRHHRGIFLHWPYWRLGVDLPGLFNPKGKCFSD